MRSTWQIVRLEMLLLVLFMGSFFEGFGQGQFSAIAPSVSQQILDAPQGQPITPANYAVDIIYGTSPGVYLVKVEGSLGSLGRVSSGTVTTPFPGGPTIYVRVRAWALGSGYGSTYEELYPIASNPGGFPNLIGASNEFTVELRQSGLQNLSGMVGFAMGNTVAFYGVAAVPEPSVVLLGGAGLALLAFYRRPR